MIISCSHQQCITCTNVKIDSFNVPLQGFLCQFQFLEFTPLCYEQQKRFNRTSAQSIGTFSALILAGIRRTGDTQVNNRERPGISTARLVLSHDQIMTFDWMWIFKRKLFVGVEIIKCVTWYVEALCILCLRFDVNPYFKSLMTLTFHYGFTLWWQNVT